MTAVKSKSRLVKQTLTIRCKLSIFLLIKEKKRLTNRKGRSGDMTPLQESPLEAPAPKTCKVLLHKR